MTDEVLRRSTPRWLNAPDGLANAYNAIEAEEFKFRRQSLDRHPDQVALWLSGLELMKTTSSLRWSFTELNDEGENAAKLQARLFSLGLAAAKSGLDSALSCMYPTAFASSRLSLESATMIILIDKDISLAHEWFKDKGAKHYHLQSPSLKTMLGRVRELDPPVDDDLMTKLETMPEQLQSFSVGSHPSAVMLSAMNPDDFHGHVDLPVYRENHSLRAFQAGLYSIHCLLAMISPLRLRSTLPSDVPQVHVWREAIKGWIMNQEVMDRVIIERLNEIQDPPCNSTPAADK